MNIVTVAQIFIGSDIFHFKSHRFPSIPALHSDMFTPSVLVIPSTDIVFKIINFQFGFGVFWLWNINTCYLLFLSGKKPEGRTRSRSQSVTKEPSTVKTQVEFVAALLCFKLGHRT